MRTHRPAVVLLLIGLFVRPSEGGDARADEVLSAARAALGGAAIEEVRGLRAHGRSSRAIGNLRLSLVVELALARPDRFVRIERVALAGAGTEMVSGFNGLAPIQKATGPDGRAMDVMALVPAAERGRTLAASTDVLRTELRLLMLGFFAASYDAAPAGVRVVGRARAPDGGEADVLEFGWAGGSPATLYVDAMTHRPLMVSWRGADVTALIPGRDTPQPAGTEVDPSSVPAAEHRLYFSDYRLVGRLHWPHRIQRAIGATTVEDFQIESFVINPAWPRAMFDPQR